MRKHINLLFCTLLLISALSFSAFAEQVTFEGNPSLYAAEQTLAIDPARVTSASHGTLSAVPTNSTLFSKLSVPKLYDPENNSVIPMSGNAFDVMVKLSGVSSGVTVSAAYTLLYYNPEVVKPMLLNGYTIYNLNTTPEGAPVSSVSTIARVPFDETVTDVWALKDLGESSYTTAYNDGEVKVINAGSDIFDSTTLNSNELYRIPFEMTGESNWYRTKVYANYYEITDGNKTDIYPILGSAGYYYNPSYNGPSFDIVGSMKKSSNELRFASIYYPDNGTYDNDVVILDAGIVCYPAVLLNDEILDVDTPDAIKIPVGGYYAKGENDSYIIYTGVLRGLNGFSDLYITAKSYITYEGNDGNPVTVYSDPISRSIAYAEVYNELSDITPSAPTAPKGGMLGLIAAKYGEAIVSTPSSWR